MQDYSISTDSLKLSLCMKDRYYAMAALGALSEHVGLSKLFHFQSLLFEVSEIQEFVMIDRTTSKSMELVSSLVGQEQVTLLGRINYTLTKMGFRLLKNNILQPLKEESLIQARQEAIQAITDDFAFHQSIQEGIALNCPKGTLHKLLVLKNFPDIDQLISTVHTRHSMVETSLICRLQRLLKVKMQNCQKEMSKQSFLFMRQFFRQKRSWIA